MPYNIFVGDFEIRVAYIAIVSYILFSLSALCVVWNCFQERTGLNALKLAPNLNPKDYDPSTFNADVNIKMTSTELEVNAQSDGVPDAHPDDELLFDAVNLSNRNPLSMSNPDDSGGALQQLALSGSFNRDTQALRLDDLPNAPKVVRIAPNSDAHREFEADNYDFGSHLELVAISPQPIEKTVTVTAVESDKARCACLGLHRLSLYSPIFFHFWDMATDLAVLCDWLPDANWMSPLSSSSPTDSSQPNTFWFIVCSLMSMFLYRAVSAYRFAQRFHGCTGLRTASQLFTHSLRLRAMECAHRAHFGVCRNGCTASS